MLARCPNCKRDLPRGKFHPNPRRKNGLRTYCKKCQRHRHRKYTHGLSKEAYLKLLKKQRKRCAVCKRKPNGRWKSLHVDHDHETGKVRGLLCYSCNIGLGHFEKFRQGYEEYLGLERKS